MKSGILFFGLLLTFMLTANLASAQSCNPAACKKASTDAAITKSTDAAVSVDEIVKAVTVASMTPSCTKPAATVQCTEEERKNCPEPCKPNCCIGDKSEAKTVKTAEVKTASTTAKSSKM